MAMFDDFGGDFLDILMGEPLSGTQAKKEERKLLEEGTASQLAFAREALASVEKMNTIAIAEFEKYFDKAMQERLDIRAGTGPPTDKSPSGRPLSEKPQGFDAAAYFEANADLADRIGGLTGAGGRALDELPTTFDPQAYLAANPDLARAYGTNGNLATNHYLDTGQYEGRNWGEGTGEPPIDPKGVNEEAAWNHYRDFGQYEGRNWGEGTGEAPIPKGGVPYETQQAEFWEKARTEIERQIEDKQAFEKGIFETNVTDIEGRFNAMKTARAEEVKLARADVKGRFESAQTERLAERTAGETQRQDFFDDAMDQRKAEVTSTETARQSRFETAVDLREQEFTDAQGAVQGRFESAEAEGLPFRTAGATATTNLMSKLAEGPGDFREGPGYKFRVGEGLKAIERKSASRGGVGGGAMQKSMMQFGQNIASQEYDKFLDRYYKSLDPLQTVAQRGAGAKTAQPGAIQPGSIAQPGTPGAGTIGQPGVAGPGSTAQPGTFSPGMLPQPGTPGVGGTSGNMGIPGAPSIAGAGANPSGGDVANLMTGAGANIASLQNMMGTISGAGAINLANQSAMDRANTQNMAMGALAAFL